ncbi:GTPase family protein [Streptomyces ossamyceticus]|uniref:GTPase family protein n=1 Tax=Streptomyces ossamyceticus TaxID=249581 RepID=UPI00099E78D7|nr:GTPase [Streptomyces ossamyceticus]
MSLYLEARQLTGDDRDGSSEDLNRTLNLLLDALDVLPDKVRRKAQAEIQLLLSMLQERRSPRLMLYGRRGAGKSALTNALFGSPVRKIGPVRTTTGTAQWEICTIGGREVQILDTRGVQESSAPEEDDPAESAEESLLTAVGEACPDVIAFLVKATDVDTAIAEDLAILERVHRETARIHETDIKIIPILTQCDWLHPSDIRFPPHDEDDEEKQRNVNEAASVLLEHLDRNAYLSQHVACDVVPTSALLFFDSQGRINKRRDYRWNIDLLAIKIQEVLPDNAQIEFARLAQFRKVQKRLAKRIVTATSVICGAVGATPIPVADMPVLTGIQATMIIMIAYISGSEVSVAASKELLVGLGGNIGAGFALREIARGILKVIPVAGNAASGAVAVAGTKALGEAAIFYFIDKKSLDDVRRNFRFGQ